MTIIAAITFYCLCSKCVPHPPQKTASGAWPKVGVTIAAPRWVKLKTRVHIEGMGDFIVQDRTAKRINGWDMLVGGDSPEDHKRAKRLGIKRVKITIP